MPMTNLETNNISLDTCFIESQNFLSGSKLIELSKLAQEGEINLFITDITYNEVLSRFRKGLILSEEKIKKPKKELETQARILRNFGDFRSYFTLPSFDIETLNKQFKEKLEKWIANAKITVVSTEQLTIKDVFKDYFDSKPPFQKEQKKNEFPDAFTFKGLEQHFSKSKTYFLSGDGDFIETKTILPISDATVLIDLIIRNKSEKQHQEEFIKLLDTKFDSERVAIEKQTEKLIEKVIKDEIASIDEYEHVRITGLNYFELVELNILPFAITHLENYKAKLEAEITFAFRFSLKGLDMNDEWFDHGYDRWHLPSEQEYLIEDTYSSNISIDTEFDPETKTISYEVTDLNNGKDLDISDSYYQIT